MNQNQYVELRSIRSTDQNEPNGERRSERLSRAIKNFCKKLSCGYCSDAYLSDDEVGTPLPNRDGNDPSLSDSTTERDHQIRMQLRKLEDSFAYRSNEINRRKEEELRSRGVTEADEIFPEIFHQELLPIMNEINEKYRQQFDSLCRESARLTAAIDPTYPSHKFLERIPECVQLNPSRYTTQRGRSEMGEEYCDKMIAWMEERRKQRLQLRAKFRQEEELDGQ